MKYVILIILLFLIGLRIYRYLTLLKIINIGNSIIIDGSIKSGKSLLSVYLIDYRIKLNRFLRLFNFLLPKSKKIKKINVYSNIPLKMKYIPLTMDIIKRREKVTEKAICFFDEASLLADSMLYANKEVNKEIKMFCKLYGHFSHGGYLIYNTQSYKDLQYNIKRNTNQYFTIVESKKLVFWIKLTLKQVLVVDETTRVGEDDIKIFVPKRVFKKYDRYCFSSLTDDLPTNISYNKDKGLKTNTIISFDKDFNNDEVISK